MRVLNSIPFDSQRIIHCYPDDYTFVIISIENNTTRVISLEAESLKLISGFSFDIDLNKHFDVCIDSSCIYVPTNLGQIVVIDKFSGQILNTINVALPIVSNLSQHGDAVCCVCGIPISRKQTLMTDKFSTCIFDKFSGKKVIQTSYFGGSKFWIQAIEDYVFVVTGTYILKYSKEGLVGSASLAHAPDYIPIITAEYIFLLSNNGILRVLDTKDLSLSHLYKIEPSISRLLFSDKQIFWLSKNGVCSVNHNKKEHKFKNIGVNIASGSAISSNNETLYFGDDQGGLVQFDVYSEETSTIKLSDQVLDNFAYCDGYLMVTSQNQIHLIEA